jgi:hypothetical protein
MRTSHHLNRRTFSKLAGAAGLSYAVSYTVAQQAASGAVPLFDGRTLDGWTQLENNATSLSTSQITNQAAFVQQIASGQNAVSQFLRGGIQESVSSQLAGFSPSGPEAKAVIAALMKELNRIISGASIYDGERFSAVQLRPETKQLVQQSWSGPQLAHLNKLLLEDAFAANLTPAAATGWTVKDRAMASTGSGRGVIYTAGDYGRFRLMFTMRHMSGSPDHQACVLIFCARPKAGEKPLDALGGIQFQVPKGGHWDYRPGKNTDGAAEFTTIVKPQFDPHGWSRVEILADSATGTARMAVAQPVGAKAVEVLDFKDPTAGQAGPIALQMHNAGLFDEYKDISIEANPADDRLITVG